MANPGVLEDRDYERVWSDLSPSTYFDLFTGPNSGVRPVYLNSLAGMYASGW